MLYKGFPREVLRVLPAGDLNEPATPSFAKRTADVDPRNKLDRLRLNWAVMHTHDNLSIQDTFGVPCVNQPGLEKQ